ncbi:MAG: acyltransferase [Eubacteriales bacterium]|jgi:surface polysaccharide O-acyltransferase-like enzyme
MTKEMPAPMPTEEAARAELPPKTASAPPEAAGKKEKFFGIELLRILATFYIILLHVVGQGGVAAASGGKVTYTVSYLLLALAYPAVNCYALISGFVGCKSRFKLSRLLSLWLTVVFVNLAVWGAFRLLAPERAASFSLEACLKPLLTNEYWYVTAYFGLSVLTPVLNAAAELPKKTFAEMRIGLFACFVLLPKIADNDLFLTRSGYSTLWLVLLYLVGMFFRLHLLPKKRSRLCGAACLAVYGMISVFLPLQKRLTENKLLASGIENPVYLKNYAYTSVLIVLSSIALFAVFTRINVQNKAVCKFISFFSTASFGVYILHTQPLVWANLLQDAFSQFAVFSAPVMAACCLAAALGIFLACTAVEKLRALLFCVTRLDRLIVFLPSVTERAVEKVLAKMHR